MPAPSERIRVMLSSRNRDFVPDGAGARRLEDIRKEMQAELDEERFCGHEALEVWINETAGAQDGTADAWDQCMQRVGQADVVIVIYNGDAGWTREKGGCGICHAEMQHVYDRYPSRVRLVVLDFPTSPNLKLVRPEELARKSAANQAFARFVDATGLFHGKAEDAATLKDAVKLAVANAVIELAKTGSREARRGRYHLGPPLAWSRLSYVKRKEALEVTVCGFLQTIDKAIAADNGVELSLDGTPVLFRVHGIPAGFGIAEARDLIGRPYLHDHETDVSAAGAKTVGPIHVIACHKSCTESQLVAFMGHPDLFLVQPPFGFFVADQLNFVQTFVLTGCRDETATVLACQRMFDWILQSQEQPRILARARARQKIVQATRKEIDKAKGGL